MDTRWVFQPRSPLASTPRHTGSLVVGFPLKIHLSGNGVVFDGREVFGVGGGQSSSSSAQCSTPSHHNEASKHWPELKTRVSCFAFFHWSQLELFVILCSARVFVFLCSFIVFLAPDHIFILWSCHLIFICLLLWVVWYCLGWVKIQKL